MLKILRDRFKYLQWMLWLVIIVFVAFIFVDFGGGLATDGQMAPTNEAAKVGDRVVTVAEFQGQYRELEDQYRGMFGERFTPEMSRQMRLPIQALDQLIAEKVMLEEAERSGLRPSDEELREAVLEIPAFQEDGSFVGAERYREILAANGQSVAAFEDRMRDTLALQKLMQTMAEAVYVADDTVERSYRGDAEKARIRYLLLPPSRFQNEVQLTPAEVAAYFEANRAAFELPEQRVVDYILVEPARFVAAIEPREEDLRAWYGQNQAQFLRDEQVRVRHILLRVDDNRTEEAARAQIEALRRRIEAGEDFAKIASEVSEDPASKARGGDLGSFGRGRMLKEFEDAAFAAEPGTLVGPIRTSFGVHLLRVEEKTPGGQTPFEQARAQVRTRLVAERSQAAAEARARELHQTLVTAPAREAELRAAAEGSDPKLQFATTAAFGREDMVPGIGRSGPFAAAVFAAQQGRVFDPVRTSRGWVVGSVREILPPRAPELVEVEGKVRMVAGQERQRQRAERELQALRARVAAGQSLADAGKTLDLQPQEPEAFGPGGMVSGLGQAPEVVAAAFQLEVGGIGGPIATPQGPVLFEVTERTHFDPAAFAAEKEALRDRLERDELNRLLGALVERKRQELKVTYNRPLLQNMGMVGEDGEVL
jgi:peptidyl-prolyl cis-trans isomerase D